MHSLLSSICFPNSCCISVFLSVGVLCLIFVLSDVCPHSTHVTLEGSHVHWKEKNMGTLCVSLIRSKMAR